MELIEPILAIILVVIASIYILIPKRPRSQQRTDAKPTPKPDHPNTQEIKTEQGPLNERAKMIAEVTFKHMLKDIEEKERLKEIKLRAERDKENFFACCQAAKESVLQTIKVLQKVSGGDRLIAKIKENETLVFQEFIILSAAYNCLFFDSMNKYDIPDGTYRLSRMLKLSSSYGPNIDEMESDCDMVNEKMKFYVNEIDYMNTSKFALPIHLLYLLFHPQEEVNTGKYITEVDPITCLYIWDTIKNSIKVKN